MGQCEERVTKEDNNYRRYFGYNNCIANKNLQKPQLETVQYNAQNNKQDNLNQLSRAGNAHQQNIQYNSKNNTQDRLNQFSRAGNAFQQNIQYNAQNNLQDNLDQPSRVRKAYQQKTDEHQDESVNDMFSQKPPISFRPNQSSPYQPPNYPPFQEVGNIAKPCKQTKDKLHEFTRQLDNNFIEKLGWDYECPICQYGLLQSPNDVLTGQVTILEECVATPCNHYFHIECFEDWITKNENCPLCRKELNDFPYLKKHSNK